MNPERWQRIEAIFDACLERPPEQRAAVLEERCEGDAELRHEVEALLGHAGPSHELEDIVERSRKAVSFEPSGRHRQGDQVGAYRLEQCLGQGGMGSVWRARRIGEDFDQQVAIKFVGGIGAGRDFERRFRVERQILARLEHPHIARLLGGGSTTESGEPYLVMELVDGEQLLDYCDSNALGLRRRLQLFLQVAGAVEHAHRHLVVHRDLKPANILVHPESGPKLLDFGIAKLLDTESGLPDLTRSQERLLTPEYASPEQVMGRSVTTASDVYSLGVLLCEMLTGRRPRRLEGLSPADQERRLTHSSPSRPSTLVRQATAEDAVAGSDGGSKGRQREMLARRLQGDLDTIILRALDTQPERRYASASEMAADVERYLRGEPVLARPDGWPYRAGKWIRRHPWGTVAGVAIVALLSAFVGGLVVHSKQLERERDRALAAEVEARSVSDFLMHLFEVSDPGNSRGETVTARELLDRGADSITDGLKDEPEAQAALLQTLADVHNNLGLLPRAVELHRLALERRRQTLGPEHPETARSHDRLGDTLRRLGEMDEAERHLRLALDLRSAAQPPDSIELAETLNNLGLLLTERGERAAAEPLLRRGLEIRMEKLGPEHADTAVSSSNLGQLLMAERRLDEASALLESTLAGRRARLGEDHPKVALSLHTLGSLRQEQGRHDEAESLLRQALDIRRRVLPPSHPGIAQTLNNLASLLHDKLRLEEAGELYRQAIEIDRQGAGHLAFEHAFTLNNLGSLLEDLGRFDEAEELYRRSFEIRLGVLGVSSSTERIRSKLGRVALRTGRPDVASALLVAAQDWMVANVAPDNLDRLRNHERLAELRLADGDPDEAERLLRQALGDASAIESEHAVHAELLAALTKVLAVSPRPQDCLEAVESARSHPAFESDGVLVRGRLELATGLCLRAVGRQAEATAALERSLELLRPVFGAQNFWVREAQTALD